MIAQHKRLIDGPLLGSLITLAGPSVTSMMFMVVFEVVDMFWVGKLGAQPVAALSASSFYVWMLRGLALAPAIGALARVSRRTGAGDSQASARESASAILSTLFYALAITALFAPLLAPVFRWLGLSHTVRIMAVEYAGVFLSGLIFVYLMVTGEHILRGLGDTRTPMVITGISLLLNVILDPVCIFIFDMGLKGAAFATIISQILGAILMLRQVIKAQPDIIHCPLHPGLQFWKQEFFSLLGLGAPMAMSHATFSIIYLVLSGIISKFGDAPLAAVGIAHRIEGLPYFLAMGFSMATATLVGQNLGAGKPDRAQHAAYLSLRITTVALAVVSILFFFIPQHIYGLFIDDAQVIAHGVHYLKIIAIFEIFLGFEVILEGAFSGAGDTKPPFFIIFPITFLRIPMAWMLTTWGHMGVEGVWVTLSVTTFLKGLLLFIWFQRGHWKTRQV